MFHLRFSIFVRIYIEDAAFTLVFTYYYIFYCFVNQLLVILTKH